MIAWRRQSRAMVMGLLVILSLGTAHAAGSWVATAPPVRVVMAERTVDSAALRPPDSALATGQRIGRVSWQYRVPPEAGVEAWLCHPGGCISLAGGSGRSERLAGMAADAPLHFRFALQNRRQRGVTVQGLQVIVNHDG